MRQGRLHFLDGLRGWGAVVVVFYHAFVDGFPAAPSASAHLWRVPFFNGGLAVGTFFLLSGLALSTAYVRTQDGAALARLAIGRYFRLALPIAAACTIVFVLMKTGAISPSQDGRFAGFLAFDPSVADLLYFSFWGTFFDYSPKTTFIPPLWTMPIELIGSFMVFGLLAAIGRYRYRLLVFGVLFMALLALHSFYCLFVAGLLVAELQSRLDPRAWKTGIGLIIAGLILSATGYRTEQIAYQHVLAPVLVFAGIMMFSPAVEFLENRVSHVLGRISFPLYLIHVPVMLVVSLHLLAALEAAGWAHGTASLVAAGVTVPVAIAASLVFVPVNDWAMRLARWIGVVAVAAAQTVWARPAEGDASI